ncbi:MAG: hypothetical protein ACK51N_02895 [bacterium]
MSELANPPLYKAAERQASEAKEPAWADALPWADCPLPGRCPVEGLLSQQELNLAYWLGAVHWQGRGRIVELGCFLGAGTVALAMGLQASGRAVPRGTLVTHDLFTAWPGSEARCHHPFRAGDSFRELFDLNTRRWSDLLTVRDRPLPDAWHAGDASDFHAVNAADDQEIESIFVDAAKSPGLSRNILRLFAPRLRPGHGLLVQQDGKWTNWWLTLHMHALREQLRPWRSVPDGGTLVYRCVAPVGPALESLARMGPDSGYGLDRWNAALAAAEADWPGQVLTYFRLQRALHHAEHGEPTTGAALALEEIDRICTGQRHTEFGHGQAAREIAGMVARTLPDRCEMAARLLRRGEDAARTCRWRMDQARSALWRMVGDGLARAGRRRIALLGGGRHTRDLLSLGWAESHGLTVVAVLDDRPEDWRPEPAWPVCIPLATGANCRVDAVVASSDAAEATLVQRAKDSGLPGDRIIGVYATSGQSPC